MHLKYGIILYDTNYLFRAHWQLFSYFTLQTNLFNVGRTLWVNVKCRKAVKGNILRSVLSTFDQSSSIIVGYLN